MTLTQIGNDAATCDGGVCALPGAAGDTPADAAAGAKLTLISFPLCPFVQRPVIALKERGAEFGVVYVDLADKPDWFLAISPLGKVPVLKVEGVAADPVILFESAVILEYLDETLPGPRLYPADALDRARQRAWVEYAGLVLGDLWRLTQAGDKAALAEGAAALKSRLAALEKELRGPFFAGADFSAVDVVYAPAFRQVDLIESLHLPLGLLDGLPGLQGWAKALAARPSVRDAVPADYRDRFLANLRKADSALLNPAV